MQYKLGVIGLLVVCLSACGGGGSSSDKKTEPTPNVAPVAEAGVNQAVIAGQSVSLNASSCTDSDGSIAAYSWRQVSGTTVVLANDSQAIASFTAPDVNDDLTFEITVTDNDGATASDTVVVSVSIPTYTVAGTITVPVGNMVDSDLNDPFAPRVTNNTLVDAQPITNPVILGGYLNVAGTGFPGASLALGDEDDFYEVELLAGQTITLSVADWQEADADLYLLDNNGNPVDASETATQFEQLTVASSGNYYLRVKIYSGATNYTLVVGQNLSVSGVEVEPLQVSRDFIPGDIIVELTDSMKKTGSLHIQRSLSTDAVMVAGDRSRAMRWQLPQQAADKLNRLSTPSVKSDAIVFTDPDMQRKHETLQAIKSLRKQAGVKFAEPNFRVKAQATPNDPYYGLQWHYPMINLPAAWELETGDPSVIVAVIDTGVLTDHPDLAGQLIAGYDFISDPDSAGDGDGIDSDPYDEGDGSGLVESSFHGTHVTGTIAANTNSTIPVGVAGVAWGVKVMPLRALGKDGGSTYDMNQAIRYAAGLSNDSGTFPAQAADIINLSLGGEGFLQSVQNTITEVRAQGIMVVAAAGNESTSATFYPAGYDGVISVSAVGPDSQLAPYSNFGTTVDVTAPGGNSNTDFDGNGYPDGVLSTLGSESGSTVTPSYAFSFGTSMAAPHVSGVLALMKSANSALTPTMVDDLLVSGAITDDLGTPGRDNSFGYGLINANKAVLEALTAGSGSTTVTPQLHVTPSSLSFVGINDIAIAVTNLGDSGLTLDSYSIPPGDTWLSLTAVSVDGDDLGVYRVSVDRTGLSDGVYASSITFTPNAPYAAVTIPVLLQVSTLTNNQDAGLTYVLLVDIASDTVVAQDAVLVEDGEYNFSLTDVPAGSYNLYAGSDMDNDLVICDAGETCAAYLTLDSPRIIEVSNNNLTGIDFNIGFQSQVSNVTGLSDSIPVMPIPLLNRQAVTPEKASQIGISRQ